MSGPRRDEPAFNRRRFLGLGGAGILLASTGGRLFAATTSEGDLRSDPYNIATWEALAGSRLTLRAGAEEQTVVAHSPVKGAGGAYTVVLAQERIFANTNTLRDGTYQLEHGRTGRFQLFVVSAGPGRYVATVNN